IEAHLAEGNWVEGWRSYQRYRDLLGRELGVEPSADLVALLQTTRHDRSARSQELHLQAVPS
ncbi:MAG: BTAD domain-containing putative transcriptional regulator, partial [Pseudonocardiaceae bacterium]